MMVMSIGFNPFYNNTDKTAEAWLLHTFSSDFYGERGGGCWGCYRSEGGGSRCVARLWCTLPCDCIPVEQQLVSSGAPLAAWWIRHMQRLTGCWVTAKGFLAACVQPGQDSSKPA